MRQIQHWIDGQLTGGTGGRVGEVFNPATGEQTGEVALGSHADVDRAVQTASAAFETWRFSSLTQRQNIMFAFRELVATRKMDFARVLTAEHGKTIDDALGEVQRGLEVVEFACNIAHLLKGDFSEQVSTGVDTYTIRQPLGVVGLHRVERALAEVPVDAPWKAPKAAEWDRTTLEAWKVQNLTTSGSRALFDLACEAIYGAEPREITLLYNLAYTAAAGNEKNPGNFALLVATPDGAQESRFVGGSQRIPLLVARRLGAQVVLKAPVRRIVQGHGRVKVHADGIVVDAREVIVAVPPVLAAQIHFAPKLPQAHLKLLKGIRPGKLIKWEAVYERPFWRDAGLSGQAVSEVGPANTTFDNTPPSGSPGILFGFVGGDQARAFAKMSRSARRDAVLGNFATYFGDEARSPKASFEMNWAQEAWTKGCPVGHSGVGVLQRYGPQLRKPFRHVHWAGTEVATYWTGYMDGAVRSGEAAAREVLRALRR